MNNGNADINQATASIQTIEDTKSIKFNRSKTQSTISSFRSSSLSSVAFCTKLDKTQYSEKGVRKSHPF